MQSRCSIRSLLASSSRAITYGTVVLENTGHDELVLRRAVATTVRGPVEVVAGRPAAPREPRPCGRQRRTRRSPRRA